MQYLATLPISQFYRANKGAQWEDRNAVKIGPASADDTGIASLNSRIERPAVRVGHRNG
jgi:hypothetical protein